MCVRLSSQGFSSPWPVVRAVLEGRAISLSIYDHGVWHAVYRLLSSLL